MKVRCSKICVEQYHCLEEGKVSAECVGEQITDQIQIVAAPW